MFKRLYFQFLLAKNPPPACLQVPMPYLPSMDVCIKMFDIYTPGRNLHACVNFLTRIEHAEVLVLEFDCFVIGRDGFNLQKYNTTSSTTAADSTAVTTTKVQDDATVPYYNATEPTLDLTVVNTNNSIVTGINIT